VPVARKFVTLNSFFFFHASTEVIIHCDMGQNRQASMEKFGKPARTKRGSCPGKSVLSTTFLLRHALQAPACPKIKMKKVPFWSISSFLLRSGPDKEEKKQGQNRKFLANTAQDSIA
jgi:hypothetical protein